MQKDIIKYRQFTVRIPTELHKRLKAKAAYQEKSMVNIIERLIKEFVEENKK